jgi:hypothetical protein
MNNRRGFVLGVGSALLGSAAAPKMVAAAPDNGPDSQGVLYVTGLVWNSTLTGISGELRMTVYLAINEDGTGTGTLSDPVHSHVNSHLKIVRTLRRGNRIDFHGEISLSRVAEAVGQQFVVLADVHGESTRVWLQIGEETFDGPGITNLRANASGIGGGSVAPPLLVR